MVIIENINFSKGVSRMLGLSLDTWNNIMLVSLGFAALSALAVGISTYAVIKLQKIEATESARNFDIYKTGVASEVAEAKEGAERAKREAAALSLETARTAQKTADLAIEASAQRERAAKAESELLALKERLAPRAFTPRARAALVANLTSGPKLPVNMRVPVTAGSEAHEYAHTLRSILSDAGWDVSEVVLIAWSPVPVGIELLQRNKGATTPAMQSIAAAFMTANVQFSAKFDSFLETPIPEDHIDIVVGTKPVE